MLFLMRRARIPIETATGMQHVFTYFQGFGGVQTLLRQHLLADPGFVRETSVLALLDSRADGECPSVRTLRKLRFASARTLRKAFLEEARPSGTWIYHNFWGAALLADLDRASRRIGFLHSSWPGYETIIAAHDGLFDGILCGDEMMQAAVQFMLPGLPPERVRSIAYPIDVPPAASSEPLPRREALRIGFCGRIEVPQKRVDRIPEFVRLLDAEPFNWEFQVMGEGPALLDLRRQLGSHERVRFLGRLSGDAYWQEIRSWDAIVFFSDYEGTPLALLGGMACGVLPVYPRISTGGDAYASGIHPALLYKSGDVSGAVAAVRWIAEQPADALENYRQKARHAIESHAPAEYMRTFHSFVKEVEALPAIASPRSRRGTVLDFLPLAAVLRLKPDWIFRSAS